MKNSNIQTIEQCRKFEVNWKVVVQNENDEAKFCQ